jgi:hypothetical protein
MGLRDQLRRMKREASRDAVLIHQRDGSTRAFDRMHVMGQMYLARLNASLGRLRHDSDVLDALDGATPEARRAVEEMSAGGFYGDLEPHDDASPPEDLSEP